MCRSIVTVVLAGLLAPLAVPVEHASAGEAPGIGSEPGQLVEVEETLFFTADDEVHGRELWKSDGTEVGTILVRDIYRGAASGSPRSLTVLNGTLYFSANDGVHRRELWKSDGTEAGTVLVKDIDPAGASVPRALGIAGGDLFFSVRDQAGVRNLWKSDGTEAGTRLVKDVRRPLGETIGNLTDVQGTLFFSVGCTLWKSDGTRSGTVLVQRFCLEGRPLAGLTAFDGGLFFLAAVHGAFFGLLRNDGTAESTEQVFGSGSAGIPLDLGGTLFFTAHGGSDIKFELYRSDGTQAGTFLVKDINPGGASYPSYLTGVGSTLFFVAADGEGGATGRELWKSDGTEAGTVLVKEVSAGDSSIMSLVEVGDALFFTAVRGSFGRELWMSDGTETGTVMVADINPADGIGSRPLELSDVDGTLFFAADDGVHGLELWKSDGTEAGTTLVKDIA